MGLPNANENEFYGFWKFSYLALEKFWKSIGNCFERVFASHISKVETKISVRLSALK